MMNISDQEFKLFQNLVYEKAGIFLSEIKKNLLHNRLQKRLRILKLQSFNDYYKCIIQDSDELKNFMDVITTHETSFFRDARLFDTFATKILPEVLEKKGNGEKIRIWSSACSTGEEPYSIAIAVLETVKEVGVADITIYASDISIESLNKAKDGRYKADKLENIKDDVIAKYFTTPLRPSITKVGTEEGVKEYQVSNVIKRFVKFIHHNLKEPFEVDGMDIIFCRNVLIYFDKESKQRVMNELTRCLISGGYLFLGGAEGLQNSKAFKYMAPSIYKKT